MKPSKVVLINLKRDYNLRKILNQNRIENPEATANAGPTARLNQPCSFDRAFLVFMISVSSKAGRPTLVSATLAVYRPPSDHHQPMDVDVLSCALQHPCCDLVHFDAASEEGTFYVLTPNPQYNSHKSGV